MNHLVPRHTERRPACPVARTLTVCIVDPNTDDYQGWQATAETHSLRLKLFATAEEALRFSRIMGVDLWVVNAELPGLSGYELCDMLKARDSRKAVYLVTNEYSLEAERRAWSQRATAFLCKPAHHDAFAPWLERARGVPRDYSISVAHPA